MRRRDQGISNAWSFLLGCVLLTLIVPGVLLGPARAIRLIASAVSGTVMQGTTPRQEVRQQHLVPLVELDTREKVLVYQGVQHPVEVLPLEKGHSIRTTSAIVPAYGPYRQVDITTPSEDLLGGISALWVAGRMGVPVPWMELVHFTENGDDAGIRQFAEAIDDRFESYRNISNAPVPVFVQQEQVNTADAWSGPGNWVLVGQEDAPATERLNDLFTVVDDPDLPIAERRQQLEQLVDVEGFTRFFAALQMLAVVEGERVRYALVLNPRTDRFYPVLIEAPFVRQGGTSLAANEHDQLEARMMAVPEWRAQRDAHVQQAIRDLHVQGTFQERLENLAGTVAPSLATTTTASRRLFSMRDPEHSEAALQWSTADLRSRVNAHWEQLSAGAANVIVP